MLLGNMKTGKIKNRVYIINLKEFFGNDDPADEDDASWFHFPTQLGSLTIINGVMNSITRETNLNKSTNKTVSWAVSRAARLHPATVRQTRRGLQVVVGTLREASIATWQRHPKARGKHEKET